MSYLLTASFVFSITISLSLIKLTFPFRFSQFSPVHHQLSAYSRRARSMSMASTIPETILLGTGSSSRKMILEEMDIKVSSSNPYAAILISYYLYFYALVFGY